MPLSIVNFSEGRDFFFTERFKVLVRSEREILLRQTQEIPIVSHAQLYAYRYDFYRFLRVQGIENHMLWVTAYLNGIEDPFMDCAGMQSYKIIDEAHLTQAVARSNTTQA